MTVAVAVLLFLAVLVWPAGWAHRSRGFIAQPRPANAAAPGPDSERSSPVAGPESSTADDAADVATAMDLLALALTGGAGVTESIEVVAAEVGGEAGRQLRVVSAGLRWGMDDQAAWANLPPTWSPAARAMSLAGLAGVPPGELLAAGAADVRRAQQARLEVAASKLGVALVLPLGLAFLPAFVLMTVLPVVLALAQDVLGQA
ncbi:type II secretion system F family protein [Segeticoccus rhizosphaerae]|jgi:pilus assembly protein TadC|uniref:type II secretion system F family protein n=1 Tax=Segeticoccus rhizosphaerae TaxID=1104777 RepID=UPI0010C01D9A|nr:type II secretion system F family protein [Ornithinicoccus soli]